MTTDEFCSIISRSICSPTSSTKGKPTKLHKRKHQIGSLYFDMRSKEMELAERRSKGFLTKAETHAKYGW
ncbi:proline-rich protein PRCC [Tanacetum coccineum]